MLQFRKSKDRGQADYGWLKTKYTFSFANYYNPQQMGFRSLRVINEDHIAPDSGFGTHPHEEMEIITYMLDGTITHRDSMNNEKTLEADEVQAMTAGTGITHSELNRDKKKPIHLFQIWLLPKQPGLTPAYEEMHFHAEEKLNKLKLIVSGNSEAGSLKINQDLQLYASKLEESAMLHYVLNPGRHAWLQLIDGELKVNGQTLEKGDGAAISEESSFRLTASRDSHFLLFDLA